MTPEEQAVIDAAIEFYGPHPVAIADECGTAAEYVLRDAISALSESRQPQLQWFSRTWADVRAGDRVRLVVARDQPALVKSIMVLPWHVDPVSARGRTPIARKWSECVITLDGVPDPVRFPPSAEIEIEMDVRTHEAMILLGGWGNRAS